MADQDPYAATAVKVARTAKAAATPAGDPYAATAVQTAPPPPPPPPADLTTNAIDPATGSGYGLYRMGSYDFDQGQVSKPEIQVPFNRVADAQAAGYKLHPDENSRYQNDTAHNGSWSRAASQVKNLLTRMTEPLPDTPVTGNAWNKLTAAAGNVEKLPINVVNRAARSLAGLPQGVAQTAAGIYKGDPAALESLDPATMVENAYKGMQQDTSDLGPMAALGNLGGDATTMYLTGKYGPRVADPMLDVVKKTGGIPESILRAVTDTGGGPIKNLVKQKQLVNEDITKANALTSQKHLGDTQDALHEQEGREIGYDQAKAGKAQEIDRADKSEATQLTAAQRSAEQKVKTANDTVRARHQAAEQKVIADNEAVKAKHQAIVDKVQAGNRAAENTLNLRRQQEQAYQQATAAHYAKEEAADTAAKAEENQAWAAWRGKTVGKTLDGGQISEPLARLRLTSPEVDRTLNQLEPRGDEVPQESPYAQIREQTSQQHFGKDYESLSPVKQDEIDDLLHASGHSPDLISFDPQAGQPISIDRVQRAYSILQRYIRGGRFEGPLLGEMKQVAGVLRNAVTRASDAAGAAPDLEAARKSTITYQDAFGREINPRVTARAIREKQLNPEAFQTRADEERLARARRYDPTLVDSYRQVKAQREMLDKFPAEDQLRKSLRQVPPPPTVNDTRPGFRLNAPPPPPTVGDLRPGFRLTEPPQRAPARLTPGSPEERAFQTVAQPDRPNFPDRPALKPQETISAADRKLAREKAFDTRRDWINHRGMIVSTWPIFQTMRALWGGHIPSIPMMALETIGSVATLRTATALLEYPPMVEFLTRAQPEDVALIPPELRGDLPGLVNLARQQRIKVAPALIAATAAMAGQHSQPAQQPPNPVPPQGASQ